MAPAEHTLTSQRIVDFDRPPVAETALGVVFAPLSRWSALHFGLLWERFRSRYPRTEIKLATPAVQAAPPQAGPTGVFSFADSMDFPIRALFIDSNGNELIQVQRNAFIRNWRQTEQTTEYQHYDNVRPRFERDWKAFSEFLSDENLGSIDVVQCEVTYINHLVRGQDWETFEDVSKVFRVWSGGNVGTLKASQMASFMVAYDLPKSLGRLQVVVQPGIRKTDSKEIIQFGLTATLKSDGSGLPEILAALDSGHVAVVTGFRDFTTAEMHSHWGIK